MSPSALTTIRQRSSARGVGKASSDSEVAHGKGKGKGKGRKGKTKERWPFLEELTVDELARYRRKRVQDRPKDNLQSHPESAIQNSASEYRRAFGANVKELSKVSIQDVYFIFRKNPFGVVSRFF